MKKNVKKLISGICTFLLILTMLVPNIMAKNIYAETESDPFIVVSMGDSYSSGEGTEKFYGQNKDLMDKVEDQDWLAHRSRECWPGKLHFPVIDDNLIGSYKYNEGTSNDFCKWYFVASSGATTEDFYNGQKKFIYKKGLYNTNIPLIRSVNLNPQFDILDEISEQYGIESVDYVTLTIGGNDVDFAGIITKCVLEPSYITASYGLNKKLSDLKDNINTINNNIKGIYWGIHRKAPSAEIVVAGYPMLLNAKGLSISELETGIINDDIIWFNNQLFHNVEECKPFMPIHFVSVIEKFKNHEAYTKNAWINPVIPGAKSEDLNELSLASAYSIHPNIDGINAYAECVNDAIDEIGRTIIGRVIDEVNEKPLEDVTVSVLDDYGFPLYSGNPSYPNGNFSIVVPKSNKEYSLQFVKDGYTKKVLDNVYVTGKTDIGTIALEEKYSQGGTITDTWDQIIASCNDGTYKSKYHIGDTKALDLGSEGNVEMQIAAFDADELADGSGKAAITWISKQLINSDHRMNPKLEVDPSGSSEYLSGTGCIGGWEKSEMRSWLQSEIKPLIPSTVRNAIKPVKKYSTWSDDSLNDLNDQNTTDEVWIPSWKEIFGSISSVSDYLDSYGSEGPAYPLFDSLSDCTKKKVNDSNASEWWLRSGFNYHYFACVSSSANGGHGNDACDKENGVAIGFCTGVSSGKSLNGGPYPSDQKYWIIFTEGYRNDRVELSTIDSTLPSDQLYFIWDTSVKLNNITGSSECDQFSLDENNEWVHDRTYRLLTDWATNIFASNLDIYDSDGNLILPKTSYDKINWDDILKYKK